jgi:hypothetical protein
LGVGRVARRNAKETDMKTRSINWTLDNNINLNTIGDEANWHRATMIDLLVGRGLDRDDAESFVAFAINEKAIIAGNGRSDTESIDLVTDEQYARLS